MMPWRRVAADEAELAVDGCGGAASIVPALGRVVGKRGIGVLKVGDGNCGIVSKLVNSQILQG